MSGADDVMVLLQTHERHAKKGRSRRTSDSDSDDSGEEAAKRKNTGARPAPATSGPAFGVEPKSKCENKAFHVDASFMNKFVIVVNYFDYYNSICLVICIPK